ncbi:MAG: hypothetical protein WED09_11960 [Homoserinimonas sp.]
MSNSPTTPAKALKGVSLPESVQSHELLDESAWLALRDSGIEPLHATEMVTTADSRAEFLVGAWLLDRTVKDGGLLNNIKPQMLRVVDVLAAGRLINGVIEPRRSSKTTTLFCILLGRCYLRDVHFAGFTLATTQKKAAERFMLDIYGPIVRQWPEEKERPVALYKGNGGWRVEFKNGSVMHVLSPDGEAFRSAAYDTLLVDEGGEASPAMGEDIQSAVLPAFDTRPDGQFIVAGTAAKFRETNLLWDTINDPDSGVLRFTVPDSVSDEELAGWEPSEEHPEARVRELIEGMHPGVGTLTTLDRIAVNYRKLGIELFSREYLGLFGTFGSTSTILNQEQWALAGTGAALPPMPERFALAFTPHPDQLCVSVLAAWRDEEGRAVPFLLDHRMGIEWAAALLLTVSRKYSVPITYDAGSQVAALIVEQLNRAKPRPRLDPQTFPDVKKAASLIVDEVERGNIEHYRQPELESAVKLAVKRKAGVNGWAFGRDPKSPNDDVTGVEAWSLAQLAYDLAKPKRRSTSRVGS